MIIDPDGKPMSPTAGRRGSKRYGYYVTRLAPNEDSRSKWRLPAGDIDRLVVEAIAYHLQSENQLAENCPERLSEKRNRYAKWAKKLPDMTVPEKRKLMIE